MAVVRALQYARTLSPDDLRAVHFDIDTKVARELEADWGRFGLGRLPLDIVEVPDRRLGRAAIELVADATLDGDTECTVLLPRRSYRRVWQRFLHDRTADRIAAVLGQVPHVSATIVPFAVAAPFGDRVRSSVARSSGRGSTPLLRPTPGLWTLRAATVVNRMGRRDGPKRPATVLAADQTLAQRAGATTAIASVVPRAACAGSGQVKSVRVQPRAGTSEPRMRAQ